MAHKVHPKIFRIQKLSDWDSRWLDKKNLSENLKEDFEIREYLEKKLKRLGVEKIEIERFPGKIRIIISTARPGIIVGRGGSGIEELRKEIERKILAKNKKSSLRKKELRIEIKEVKNLWTSAALVAQYIAQQLEKRIPFRRVLKQALERIMSNKEVKGARIEVAGRLDGAEIARTEYLKRGRLPRQTLRADIDYACDRAYCTYGVVGTKVWIYKGERSE